MGSVCLCCIYSQDGEEEEGEEHEGPPNLDWIDACLHSTSSSSSSTASKVLLSSTPVSSSLGAALLLMKRNHTVDLISLCMCI
jgi:hypothetical protein